MFLALSVCQSGSYLIIQATPFLPCILMEGTYNNMVRVCTIKYVNGKDDNGLFLEIEDIDAGSVVLKQEDG